MSLVVITILTCTFIEIDDSKITKSLSHLPEIQMLILIEHPFPVSKGCGHIYMNESFLAK